MLRIRLAALLTLLVVLALPAAASADHDTSYRWGEKESPFYSPAMKNLTPPTFEGGPCTGETRRAMPAAGDHDHLKVEQHNFKCQMSKVFFDSLTEILEVRPEIVLGEMDIKGNLMVIGVAYPESGFLLYDITNPAQPKFLSHYRGEECENVYLDVDCGAYVDLSPTGKRVYLSVQQISVASTAGIDRRPLSAYPGVEVIDISNPTLPLLLQAQPVVSVGGVHTTKSFMVPETGGAGPREPGEYTVSVANGVGLTIHAVTPAGTLAPIHTIDVGETHDTFIQDDPLTGRTLLYAAGGFTTGFYVWDITAPSAPELLAEWDITPDCGSDWYAHTIDVAIRNGRRYVTMPNELIDFFGEVGDPENCGQFSGMGDYAGPMFIVDATDLNKLGPAVMGAQEEADMPALKAASEAALVTSWYNPALRAGGELTFSPHNQQIIGNKIYLSQYHGGVVVLDATEAFAGKNVRPKEVGLYVPHEGPTRPIAPDAGGGNGGEHFVTGFIDYRPLVWDTMYANGHVFIPDMTGGLTVVREDDSPGAVISGPGIQPSGCGDRIAPRGRVRKVKATRKRIKVSGRASDRGCDANARVARVSVAIGRRVGKKCSFLSSLKRFRKARSCKKPIFLTAKGTKKWSYTRKGRLKKGKYFAFVRVTDAAGNRSKATRKRARVR